MVVALAVFALDRVTKGLVNASLAYGERTTVIPNVVDIVNVRNSGAAFGFAPAGTILFLIASVVVAIGLVVYVARNPGTPWSDGVLGLVMGGTLGNGYDRVVHGTVTDFIDFHFWPVFNVADSAVSVGVALLIAGYLLRRPAS
ncbi:MAG TPA: signal peptidase II [Candidatus Dormibacteraeota bacterium]|nr:signal peptidase II [Candidatus Dormibacteraeota bacterium]